MIEFNRKLELLELSFKYDKIKELFESEEFLNLIVEEQNFLKIVVKIFFKYQDMDIKLESNNIKEIYFMTNNYFRIKKGEIPRCVFRYDNLENAKRSLLGGYVWLSSIKKFNDPFEGIMHSDYDNAKINELADYYFKRQGKDPSYTDKRKFKENLKKTKERKRLIEEIKNTHKSNIEAAGVFCCSEIPDNITMWAHYSENHKGVCLEYDVLRDSLSLNFVNKINYLIEYPPKASLRETLEDKEKSLLKISLLTKSKIWENEKEIRILKAFKKGSLNIKKDCLKSIIFGLRCASDNKEKIINDMIEKGYDKNTEIKKAVKAENEYRIEIEKVGVLGDPVQELIK